MSVEPAETQRCEKASVGSQHQHSIFLCRNVIAISSVAVLCLAGHRSIRRYVVSPS